MNDESQFIIAYSCKNCGYLISETEAKALKCDLECPECRCKLFRQKPIQKPKPTKAKRG